MQAVPAAGRTAGHLIDQQLALTQRVIAWLEEKLSKPDLLTPREFDQYDKALSRQTRAVTGLSAELRQRQRAEMRGLEASGFAGRRDAVIEWVCGLPPEQRQDFLVALAARASGNTTPEGPKADG